MKFKFPSLRASYGSKKKSRQPNRNLRLEALEDRSLLTLLGIAAELDFPVISYNGTGEYSFESASGLFSVEATPLAFKGDSGSPIRMVTGANRAVEINITLDNAGNLVGGVPGDDFVLTGEIDLDGDTVPDVTGTLLTGEVTAFGFLDTTATKDDFDFRFTPTGGELLSMFFTGQDIGITMFSENSNFAGSFAQDFSGVKVKGNIGAIETIPAMLGDFVWHDLNANGIQDAGEPGIAGVKVTLIGGGLDGIIGSGGDDTMEMMFTDADGLYKFNNLNPGEEYQVTFENPDTAGDDAYMFSPRQIGGDPSIDSDAMTSDIVTLSSGEFNQTLDAGLFRKGSIHVFGYLDQDGEGDFDGEDGAFPDDPGKTFELFAGTSTEGTPLDTQTTVNGMAWFTGLTPGQYTVRENPVPDGYTLTTTNARTFTITSGEELVYEDGAAMLPSGDQRFETNLGDELRWGNTEEQVELAMLGDFVWHDLNANGIQDLGEPGIAGVKVTLIGGGLDGIIGSGGDDTMEMMFTDASGMYKFNDLNPGEQYQVTFENPDTVGDDAYMFSPRQVGGDPSVDSDGMTSDIVTLLPGEFNQTLDAGLFRKGSIHVFGYLDQDGEGDFDGEDGAFPDDPGKTFELFAGTSTEGTPLDTQTTVNGMAWFTGLTPGQYTVRENPIPDGYTLTTTNARTFTITSGEELVYEDGAAMLPSGDQRFETNLGDQLRWGNTEEQVELAMLGDFVWHDLNANGIQDLGEPGIAGVKVTLIGGGLDGIIGSGGDDTMEMMFTDADGLYKFNDLNPGEQYQVTFENPDTVGDDAYMFSPRQVGGDPSIDSDGMTSDIVTLLPGEFNQTLDAGLFRKGSIHVFGYLDQDGEGDFDGEDGAFPDDPGKTFELFAGTSTEGTPLDTQTTVNGMAWFTGLTPGQYTVRENPIPDGYTLTTTNARTFTITSGEELVYEDGAAMLPSGDQRFETNVGDDLRWGNTPKQDCEPCKPCPEQCKCSKCCGHNKPKKCGYDKPSKCAYEKPSKCVKAKPSKCSYQKPSKCAKAKPSKCSYQKPSKCSYQKPSKCNSNQPSKPSYCESSCEVDCVYEQWGAKNKCDTQYSQKSSSCGSQNYANSCQSNGYKQSSSCDNNRAKSCDKAFYFYGCGQAPKSWC